MQGVSKVEALWITGTVFRNAVALAPPHHAVGKLRGAINGTASLVASGRRGTLTASCMAPEAPHPEDERSPA